MSENGENGHSSFPECKVVQGSFFLSVHQSKGNHSQYEQEEQIQRPKTSMHVSI